MASDRVVPAQLRQAIAEALANNVKAYSLEDACVALGLPPARDGENPFDSKRVYVNTRLEGRAMPSLVEIARGVVEQYGDETLESLLSRVGPHGVDGELKNLIFAANGPKPRIVLRDALNNVIEIVQNQEYCLVYDEPLSSPGLTWRDLVRWWNRVAPVYGCERGARALYKRLAESLANDPERLLFRTYCERYADGNVDLPALIPQVYLHYDPYTIKELAMTSGSVLKRQRMDFLLLMSSRARAVIEIDGKQHYSSANKADPRRYAEMVGEDRRLRLSGYEVYRFGGQEFVDQEAARAMLAEFFNKLLDRHAVVA